LHRFRPFGGRRDRRPSRLKLLARIQIQPSVDSQTRSFIWFMRTRRRTTVFGDGGVWPIRARSDRRGFAVKRSEIIEARTTFRVRVIPHAFIARAIPRARECGGVWAWDG